MESWFLSDIHLKSMDERNSQVLLRFFYSILEGKRSASHIFLLGDIFDLWLSDHQYFKDQYEPLLSVIDSLVRQGVEMHYFEGNHDFHLRKYWQDELGVSVHVDHEYFTLGRHIVRAEHGDKMNPDDRAYLRWRWLMRTSPMEFVAHHFPDRIIRKIGEGLSEVSRKRNTSTRQIDPEFARALIHRYAEQLAKQEDRFDWLITGHIHVRDTYKFGHGNRTVHSVNLGSWYPTPVAYHFTDERQQFIQLEEE